MYVSNSTYTCTYIHTCFTYTYIHTCLTYTYIHVHVHQKEKHGTANAHVQNRTVNYKRTTILFVCLFACCVQRRRSPRSERKRRRVRERGRGEEEEGGKQEVNRRGKARRRLQRFSMTRYTIMASHCICTFVISGF